MEHVSFSDNQVHLRLNHGEEVSCFHFCFVVQFLKMNWNECPCILNVVLKVAIHKQAKSPIIEGLGGKLC